MGMFDTIHCHVPLPFPEDLSDPAERAALQCGSFQTKDLHCALDVYELRADGSLWVWSRPPDGEEPTFGSPRWVPATSVLGHIHFYESIGAQHSGWAEFKATIVDGHLHRPLELVTYRPVDRVEEIRRAAESEAFWERIGQPKEGEP